MNKPGARRFGVINLSVWGILSLNQNKLCWENGVFLVMVRSVSRLIFGNFMSLLLFSSGVNITASGSASASCQNKAHKRAGGRFSAFTHIQCGLKLDRYLPSSIICSLVGAFCLLSGSLRHSHRNKSWLNISVLAAFTFKSIQVIVLSFVNIHQRTLEFTLT